MQFGYRHELGFISHEQTTVGSLTLLSDT